MVQRGVWTVQASARYNLARQLKDELTEAAPDLGSSVYSDLLGAALDTVNWPKVSSPIWSPDRLARRPDARPPGFSLIPIQQQKGLNVCSRCPASSVNLVVQLAGLLSAHALRGSCRQTAVFSDSSRHAHVACRGATGPWICRLLMERQHGGTCHGKEETARKTPISTTPGTPKPPARSDARPIRILDLRPGESRTSKACSVAI